MSPESKRGASAFVAGLVFGAGLLVSGMADAPNVLGFLDVLGDWNPRLLFVMAGAIAVHAPVYVWVHKRERPWFAPRFLIPARRDLDARLWVGSSLFGIGWGMSGYCPGPVFVSLPSGQPAVLVFAAAMVVGSFLPHVFDKRVPPTEPLPLSRG
jgi:uncharacterized protein